MKKQISLCTLLILCFTVVSLGQQKVTNLDSYLEQVAESGKENALNAAYTITSQHTSRTSGIHHIYFNQALNNIRIIGTESSIHLSTNNKILKSNMKFVSDVSSRANAASPSLNAYSAIMNAASQLGLNVTKDIITLSETNSNKSVFSDGGISLSDIPVELVYFLNENGSISLGWDLSIQEKSGENWWSVIVDASNGTIINKNNWVTSCNFDHDHSEHDAHEKLDYNANLFDIPNYDALEDGLAGCTECYEVFALPLESPYFGPRTVEIDPADPIESPFGWHDTNGAPGAEFTITRGNNVHAYEDGDNPGFSPDAGADLDFIGYPFSQFFSNANQSEEAAITNLFYWNNIIHDVFNKYGFDAASGNFQENNYGLGGFGSDSVDAEAQDGSGTCNAFMGTPPDGGNPRMQMFTCGSQDGDFDNLVIAHEYGHGITNRLTGGASAAGCLQVSEQMGEGWSDYFGIILTMNEDDLAEDPRPVGTYLFGQGPNGNGIRSFPLSTDLSINPHTYDDIKTESVPHGVGSVWSAMLWDMTWLLIDEYGWDEDIYNFSGDINQDAGNVIALALVVEALKLQPCAPGFVDGRDAIFAADLAIYGGANECLIWDAFARRGLGVSADQGSSASRGDGTEAFDTPTGSAIFTAPTDVCESVGEIVAGGGTPFGGVYTGPGVTDNGNGTYTFDPVVAGVGVHTISYEVQDSNCTVASIATDEIEVLFAPQPPSSVGVVDGCGNEEVTVTATVQDPANIIKWYDEATQGTLLAEGPSYTFTPTEDTVVYAEEGPIFTTSELKISELSLQFPDVIEISNIGASFDYTGYSLAISDEPFAIFNVVNPIVQDIGAMQENSVRFYSDDAGAGPNAWGNNIWWGEGGSGWAIILDPSGNVVDSAFWNASAALISTFNVTINGFNITAADLDWQGDGADFSSVCNTSFRRTGENDDASNWLANCLPSDYGVFNDDIGLGFQDCLAARTPTFVTLETQLPTITCPEDETVIIEEGTETQLPDFTVDAIAADNCDALTITQSLNAGESVGVGVYEIELTATDGAGNEATCTFIYTVEGLLSVDEANLGANITISPNPTTGMIQLTNRTTVELQRVTVIDVNGRIIQTLVPSTIGTTDIDLTGVAQGVYFVNIESQNNSIIKRVIKR